MFDIKDDIKKLIITRTRRLQTLQLKQAKLGLSTNPEILTEIEELEAEIEQLYKESRTVNELREFDEKDELRRLIEIKEQRLLTLRVQESQLNSWDINLEILNEIKDLEEEIGQLQEKLESIEPIKLNEKGDLGKLIIFKTRSLYRLKERQTQLGLRASPEILTEIEDLETEITKLHMELQAIEDTSRSTEFVRFKNPYTFGVPARGEGRFFGREVELKLIFDTLENVPRGQKQDIVVMGPRRIGKSSILLRLLDIAPNDFLSIYIDLQSVEPRDPQILFVTILSKIITVFKHLQLADVLPPFETLNLNQVPKQLQFLTFGDDLDNLNEVIDQKQLPRLILMFDEIELLTEFGGISTLEWFRSLIQSLSYCIFIVAGSDLLYELTLDYTSPFYNIFKTIEVRALSTEAAKLLITEPGVSIGLTYPTTEVDRILHYTGRNPYFIQALCHYLIELLNQNEWTEIKPGDIDKIVPQVIDHLSFQFNYFWRSFTAVEQGLLYLLAQKKIPQTAPSLTKELLDLVDIYLSEQEQRDIFAKLSRQQTIQPIKQIKESEYWFVIQLFADWVYAKIKKEEVIDNIREKKVLTLEDSLPIPDRIKYLEETLRVYYQNLHQLEIKMVKYGGSSSYVPLYLQAGIEETKTRISRIEKLLSQIKPESRQ